MQTLSSLPDLANSFKLVKISIALEDITEAKGGMIAAAIQSGLRNRNIKGVVKMLRSMYADNDKMILYILGNDLTNDVLTVCID
jgi:hypothetical protein